MNNYPIFDQVYPVKFLGIIQGSNCAEWECDHCGKIYAAPSRPNCDCRPPNYMGKPFPIEDTTYETKYPLVLPDPPEFIRPESNWSVASPYTYLVWIGIALIIISCLLRVISRFGG